MIVTVPCPECDAPVDVEVEVVEAMLNESFWGQPVSRDETEVYVQEIPVCGECGRESVSEDAVFDMWERESM